MGFALKLQRQILISVLHPEDTARCRFAFHGCSAQPNGNCRVVVWWCGGVVVWWCGGVVVWWCGGVVVWWCGGVLSLLVIVGHCWSLLVIVGCCCWLLVVSC